MHSSHSPGCVANNWAVEVREGLYLWCTAGANLDPLQGCDGNAAQGRNLAHGSGPPGVLVGQQQRACRRSECQRLLIFLPTTCPGLFKSFRPRGDTTKYIWGYPPQHSATAGDGHAQLLLTIRGGPDYTDHLLRTSFKSIFQVWPARPPRAGHKAAAKTSAHLDVPVRKGRGPC